jgi:hypothetical protein
MLNVSGGIMTQPEKIALTAGAITGFVLGMGLVFRLQYLEKENYILRKDGVDLLNLTVELADYIPDMDVVPERIKTDIQFRCMGALSDAGE